MIDQKLLVCAKLLPQCNNLRHIVPTKGGTDAGGRGIKSHSLPGAFFGLCHYKYFHVTSALQFTTEKRELFEKLCKFLNTLMMKAVK